MSPPDAVIYVDLNSQTHLVGYFWVTQDRRGTRAASFRYADSWIEYPGRFAIDPLLDTASGGTHHKDRLFGAITDSAPDRWGRTLMTRAERFRARSEGRAQRTLREIDFVLGVSDLARQGALRFALTEGGDFVTSAEEAAIPPMIDLPQLLSAAQGFIDDPDSIDDLRVLLAPGSTLGGARPKASVLASDGSLAIAKFPRSDDSHSVNRWEHVTLELARDAGIRTAESELVTVADRAVVLLRRFDRDGATRRPFLSAMSMIDAVDQEPRSYLEIAEVIQRVGASARADLRELWRRIAFNVLVSNTDDHLRNHAFLYAGPEGWVLSPAYDLNPVPEGIKPRLLSTSIGEDPHDASASLELALAVAPYFHLEDDEARAIAAEVAGITRQWADRARQAGIGAQELDFMVSAFEHEDLDLALGR